MKLFKILKKAIQELFISRYCFKCGNWRNLLISWRKSSKSYVIKVTGGYHYACRWCENKQKNK